MNVAVRVAALALSLGGCTSLLGIDGAYGVDGESGASSSSTTIAATGAGGAGSGGADGAGGGESQGSTSSVGGGGGAGGAAAACPLCRVEARIQAEGHTPRMARSGDEFWMTYLTGEEETAHIVVRGADDSGEPLSAPGVVDAVLPGRPIDGGPVWLATGAAGFELLQDDVVLAAPLGQPPIDAVLVEGALYALGRDELDRPHLFACNGKGCFPTLSCAEAEGSWAAIASDGARGFLARHCDGGLEVTDFDDTPVGEEAGGVPGGPMAMTARGGSYALVVVANPVEADAAVRVLIDGGPLTTFDVAGAHAPAVAWTEDALVVAFTRDDGAGNTTIGLIHCASPSGDDCAEHLLAGVGSGAHAPSLGVFGDAVWIAWQEGVTVVAGQLGP